MKGTDGKGVGVSPNDQVLSIRAQGMDQMFDALGIGCRRQDEFGIAQGLELRRGRFLGRINAVVGAQFGRQLLLAITGTNRCHSESHFLGKLHPQIAQATQSLPGYGYSKAPDSFVRSSPSPLAVLVAGPIRL